MSTIALDNDAVPETTLEQVYKARLAVCGQAVDAADASVLLDMLGLLDGGERGVLQSVTAAYSAGISYRQLDHWVRMGYINADHPGQGHKRDITGSEMAVLRHMAELVKAGVTASAAAPLARRLAEGQTVAFGPWALAPLGGSV